MKNVLLIDADDTLWENFWFFEQGRKIFLKHMENLKFNVKEVDCFLKKMDSERVHEFGFGSNGYRMAMEKTIRYFFAQKGIEFTVKEESLLNEIRELVANHKIEPYDGVIPTLEYLHGKYPLFVVTKGDYKEQSSKVQRSGLIKYFKDFIVIPDKKVENYQEVISSIGLDVQTGWMIGNSPKSDINPPAKLGLGTVYIHREESWDFEHEELKTNGRFYQVTDFKELKDIF
jgi:putative hydrolase of the HAD superfamily